MSISSRCEQEKKTWHEVELGLELLIAAASDRWSLSSDLPRAALLALLALGERRTLAEEKPPKVH